MTCVVFRIFVYIYSSQKYFKFMSWQNVQLGSIKLRHSIFSVNHDICFQAGALCCHQRELKSEPYNRLALILLKHLERRNIQICSTLQFSIVNNYSRRLICGVRLRLLTSYQLYSIIR